MAPYIPLVGSDLCSLIGYSYAYRRGWSKKGNISRKPQYKDVYRRRIEFQQCTHIFQTNCCLKVHNAPLKLATSISGYDLVGGGMRVELEWVGVVCVPGRIHDISLVIVAEKVLFLFPSEIHGPEPFCQTWSVVSSMFAFV